METSRRPATFPAMLSVPAGQESKPKNAILIGVAQHRAKHADHSSLPTLLEDVFTLDRKHKTPLL